MFLLSVFLGITLFILIILLIGTIFDFGERQSLREEYKRQFEESQLKELKAKEQQEIQNNTQINIIYLDFTKKK